MVKTGVVVGPGNRWVLGCGEVCHPAIEPLAALGVAPEIVEEPHTVLSMERRLARHDAVPQGTHGMPPGAVPGYLAAQQHSIAHDLLLEEHSRRRRHKPSGLIFGEDALCSQRPQQPIE